MSIHAAIPKRFERNQSVKYSTIRKPFPHPSDPTEENLILLASSPGQARHLLKSEAEKLLEEGWEVIRVSPRSYIAVLDTYEIYLHSCSKGVSARIFDYRDPIGSQQ